MLMKVLTLHFMDETTVMVDAVIGADDVHNPPESICLELITQQQVLNLHTPWYTEV
jgi:hypothetical protein